MGKTKDQNSKKTDCEATNIEQDKEEKISKNKILEDSTVNDSITGKDKELIDQLTNQINVMQERLLRSIAESENIRSRMNKKIEETKDYSIIAFVKDLLPVIDNFSRVLLYIPVNINNDTKIIVDGIKMIETEMTSILKKYSIETINPIRGEAFDYNIHCAISQVLTDQQDENTVFDTMQVGYKIRDRLIRPASVTVVKRQQV